MLCTSGHFKFHPFQLRTIKKVESKVGFAARKSLFMFMGSLPSALAMPRYKVGHCFKIINQSWVNTWGLFYIKLVSWENLKSVFENHFSYFHICCCDSLNDKMFSLKTACNEILKWSPEWWFSHKTDFMKLDKSDLSSDFPGLRNIWSLIHLMSTYTQESIWFYEKQCYFFSTEALFSRFLNFQKTNIFPLFFLKLLKIWVLFPIKAFLI